MYNPAPCHAGENRKQSRKRQCRSCSSVSLPILVNTQCEARRVTCSSCRRRRRQSFHPRKQQGDRRNWNEGNSKQKWSLSETEARRLATSRTLSPPKVSFLFHDTVVEIFARPPFPRQIPSGGCPSIGHTCERLKIPNTLP